MSFSWIARFFRWLAAAWRRPPRPKPPQRRRGLGIDHLEDRRPLSADLSLTALRTFDSRELTVTYDVRHAAAFTVQVYESATAQPDPKVLLANHDNAVGFRLAAKAVGPHTRDNGGKLAETVGKHELTIRIPGGVPTYPKTPFVVAVVNLPGRTVDASAAHFRKASLAVVTHGFKLPGQEPAWITDLANDFKAIGYDRALPFSWTNVFASSTPGTIAGKAGNTAKAAQSMADLILKQARALVQSEHLGPNDVIDLHLAGHSMGGGMITIAFADVLRALRTTDLPQLAHGYDTLTLLDPHPTTNALGLNASFDPGISPFIVDTYRTFQRQTADAAPVISARANQVEEFFQKNPYSRSESFGLNFTGLTPTQITSKTPVAAYDISDQKVDGAFVGHDDVTTWYDQVVVPGLAKKPTVAPAFEALSWHPFAPITLHVAVKGSSGKASFTGLVGGKQPAGSVALFEDYGEADEHVVAVSRIASTGAATFKLALPKGVHHVTAVFSGDDTYRTSQTTFTLTV